MYIGDYIARRCIYTPEKIAVVDCSGKTKTPHRVSYKDLNERANKLALWLRSQGIHKGDRVAMLAHDGIYFYDAFFACCKLGASFVPYNWRLHSKEIEKQIELIQPKLLFHSFDHPISEIVEHLQSCPGMPKLVPLSSPETQISSGAIDLESSESFTCESLTEHDTACLLFTGGTTGQPKAAQISHRQIVWNTFNAQLADVLGTDTFLNIFPMFHAGGLFAFSVPILILGGTVIQTKKFEPEEVLNLIESEAVTIFCGAPTTFQMMSVAPNWQKAGLSSLRYCLSGGAPMPLTLIQKYQQEKGVVFRQGFGMTEFGPDVFSLASSDAERKAGSIGKPNFFVDARVVDPESNQPLPPTEIGELVLRGPVAMTGYFGNPGATEAAFDDENYFHTGDLAYVDEEGYFFVVERLKDMFISGGENVYPAEIEAVLYNHPDIEMCAVVGVDDEKWGQAGCVFVVLKKGCEADAATILDYLGKNLARYKIPKSVIFRESLPVSGVGKIMKTELCKSLDQKETHAR